MNKTRSKLSPWPYIRNNRVRTTALIVSLAVFMLMIYVMNYVIGGIGEPFYRSDVAPYDLQQIVSSHLDMKGSDYETDEEYLTEAWNRARTACANVPRENGVVDAKAFAWQNVPLNSVIGMTGIDCFLFEEPKDCEDYLNHMGAKLVSGKMPEKPGEILVEQKLIRNHKNDNNLMQYMGSTYEVVGSVNSDYYLAFGLAQPGENDINVLILTERGSSVDAAEAFAKTGYEVSWYRNKEKAEKNHKDGIGSMDTVQTLITSVSGSLLLICVTVVLALHIMDRHNEWCLLHSIGFSTGEIYVMALKEILICVAIAMVAGAVLSVMTVLAMNALLYEPIGVAIRIWRWEALPRIFIVMLFLIGVAQIPIFSGMRKIQTIDSIES
ncbi:MAG: ABC transporter permease [Clostridiales bacterium]|nr:ABC transporter permease [Clostridiales bacterium]